MGDPRRRIAARIPSALSRAPVTRVVLAVAVARSTSTLTELALMKGIGGTHEARIAAYRRHPRDRARGGAADSGRAAGAEPRRTRTAACRQHPPGHRRRAGHRQTQRGGHLPGKRQEPSPREVPLRPGNQITCNFRHLPHSSPLVLASAQAPRLGASDRHRPAPTLSVAGARHRQVHPPNPAGCW